MKKSDKVFCSLCLAVLMFFFCTILVRTFTRQILVKRLGINNGFTNIVLFDANNLNDGENDEGNDQTDWKSTHKNIDWMSIYPFSDDVILQKKEQEKALGIQKRIVKKINSLENNIETYTSKFLIGYQPMNEMTQHYENLLQWNYVSYSEYNGIVKASDGYLTTLKAKTDVSECVESTVSFSKYCASKNIGFLYVNTPVKVCKETDIDISGVSDFSNQNADEFIAGLNSNDVKSFDLRTELHKDGYDHHSMFYNTDHHWKPETGLWAAGKIIGVLNSDYGFSIDSTCVETDRYTSVTYPKWFLGSQGKKVTLAASKPEDFSLLYPVFDTNLHYIVLSEGIDQVGDFSILYDMDRVEERDYYNKNPYGAYMHGDQPLQRIENNMVENGYHVLVVHDSFGDCVIPFLAMGVQYVDSIDLRHFNGSLQTYIEMEQPDVVIVMYNAFMFDDSTVQSGGLFDFR